MTEDAEMAEDTETAEDPGATEDSERTTHDDDMVMELTVDGTDNALAQPGGNSTQC